MVYFKKDAAFSVAGTWPLLEVFHLFQGRGERAYDIYSRLLRERIICVMGPVSSNARKNTQGSKIIYKKPLPVVSYLFFCPSLYLDRWHCSFSGYRSAALSPVREQQQAHSHVHQQSWWESHKCIDRKKDCSSSGFCLSGLFSQRPMV